ncbi:hypothetical protein DYB37_013829 [Aphanomyces astaci]|uniref:Serine protease n=1 Tax=Aphanomyces astaci TaxID=112090 RepID=A0A397A909_APHAT|nr:hypothetical protein DYB36_013719 [Aphanomyces astaci]RHY77237.1 hypothetical protein DYB30_013913 [Aphanomyces astaci]RHY85592.1 hypothetical protein DYB35_013823 [Aphanomyces astaci]RHY87000.1 hypothetical protein DYB26_006451 [Aphanomyces astaci]RHZ35059.1 hypothetical protein DYB37_013829 [Aphanomyces astaci]
MFSTFKAATVLALVAVASADDILDFFKGTESLCDADQSQPGRCLGDAHPIKYQLSQAVARIRTGTTGSYCTAWLWGSEGHLITNNHCVPNEIKANQTRVEFGSECSTCADPDNNVKGACIGAIVANSTTLVFTDKSLDMTLLKLNLNPGVNLTQYGYLQSRAANASLDEQIYILGHPRGNPKRISYLNDDGQAVRITNTSAESKCYEQDTLGYNVDTEHGSSGSPIVGVHDNEVVGLHNCGGCGINGRNTGNKMTSIVALLKSHNLLPKDAVADNRC